MLIFLKWRGTFGIRRRENKISFAPKRIVNGGIAVAATAALGKAVIDILSH